LNPACDGNGGAGIDAGNYDAIEVDMIGNIVHDVWADDENGMPCNRVQGLYHSIRGGTVANNITWNISGFGIHTWHAPQDLVITNNLVFGSGRGGIIVGAGDSPGGVIADNFLVANNIVAYNALGIVEFGATGENNRYLNNLVYENAGGHFSLQHGLVDEGTIVGEPMFVDWQMDGSGDYHLLPGSPAIDAGIVEGAPMQDYDGVARPQGAGIDIGPYEYFEGDGSTSSGGDEAGSDGGSEGLEDSAGDGRGDETGPSATAGGTMPESDSGVTSDTGDSSPPADGDDGGCACAATADDPRRGRWLAPLLVLLCRPRLRERQSLRGCSARRRAG
jgi:MYXO-CTERM domain-containing protein